MTTIMLRPDLKTSGGEIHDILWNGRYAGNMTLVYRERDRIGGAVQLDQQSLSEADRQEVVRFVQNYIQDLIMAVRAVDCDVIVTHSSYDHIIATRRDEAGHPKVMDEPDGDTAWAAEEQEEGSAVLDRLEMLEQDEEEFESREYELVIVGESRNRVEYHVYDGDKEFVAEALFSVHGTDVEGEIHFTFLPSEEEIEAVTDLIISDFDDDAVDTFDILILHKGMELEHIELTHEDLLDTPSYATEAMEREQRFEINLARDDGEILTYEIYSSQMGGLPIGTATVDISQRQLSGFIDFREHVSEEDREEIAAQLMRELDKEKEYHTLNLSVMLGNRKIDELMFENEMIH